MISQTSAYAIEAMLAIAGEPDDDPVRAADLADRLDIPANYLSKILNSLARARILLSTRGPTGGFRLARDASEITVEDVIGRFEDVGTSRRCFLGRGQCSDAHGCPVHEEWKRVSRPMFDFFHERTLADLLPASRKRSARGRPPAPHASARAGRPVKKQSPRGPVTKRARHG